MENIEDNFDPTLFIRPDGLPMVFLLLSGSSTWEEFRESLKTDVELRGGLVLDQEDSQYSDNLIHLLGKNEVPMKTTEMFDYRYVTDCIGDNLILPNLLDYRVTSLRPHPYENYDPLDILHGYAKWSDLNKRIDGERVSDIEDLDEDDEIVNSNIENNIKDFKVAYSRKNQEEIVKYLVKFSAYKMVKGRAIWEKLEALKVCNGKRSWQSMKEHFRKKIIYQIHTFGLTWRQVRKFRATFGLDEVHESDEDSEEEDPDEIFQQSLRDHGLDNKRFAPRRTSSPFLICDEREEDLEAGEISEGLNNDIDPRISEEVSNNDANSSTTVPVITKAAKRKRKLYSSSCDYLDVEEKNSDDQNQKNNVVGDVIQEESEIEEESDMNKSKDNEEGSDVNKSKESIDRHEENNEQQLVVEKPNSEAVKVTHPKSATEIVSFEIQQNFNLNTTECNIRKTMDEIFGPDCTPLPPAKRKSRKDDLNERLPVASESSSYSDDSFNPKHRKTPVKRKSSPIIEQSVSTISSLDLVDVPVEADCVASTSKSLINRSPQGMEMNSPTASSIQRRRYSSRNPSHRSPSPRKVKSLNTLVINTPPSVCCKQINTVDVEAIENLQPSEERRIRRKSTNTNNTNNPDAASLNETDKTDNENFNKDYWYRCKFKQPYSRGEEEAIVKYFVSNGGYSIKGGNSIWKKIEDEWICPGRTWHSLRERFEKHIEPNLPAFSTSKAALLKVDQERNIETGRGVRKDTNYYKKEEDLKIIDFIVVNKRFEDVKGNELWKVMEERKVLQKRSWQSLKNRYLKVILPKIKQYNLPKNTLSQFTKTSRKIKTRGKERRIN